MRDPLLAVVLIGALLAVACGGETPGPAADAPPGTAPAGTAPPGTAPGAAPTPTDHQIEVGGTTRTYRLLVPDGAPEPLPVLMMLHDAGNTLDGIEQITQFGRRAAADGFALVYPAALEEVGLTWNGGFCCGQAPAAGVDDVTFLDGVLDDLAGDARLDAVQVHVAGVSNGAVMAYRYACERADRIAGVGSVAGTMDVDACRPAQAVRVLEIHGTADQVVPFDGGEMPDFVQAAMPAPPARALVERWAELDGCAGDPATEEQPPVTTTTWEGCEDGTAVRLVAIDGAGHTWYAPEFGPVDGAVDASGEILRFLGLAGS